MRVDAMGLMQLTIHAASSAGSGDVPNSKFRLPMAAQRFDGVLISQGPFRIGKRTTVAKQMLVKALL